MRSISSYARSTARLALVALAMTCAAAQAHAQRSAATLYRDAQAAEQALQRSESRRAKKSEWFKVARMYHRVVLNHPQSGYCDDALYYEAELYLEAHRRFKDRVALQRSLDAYLLLANGYPASKWAKRAHLNRGKIYLEQLSDRKAASIELRKVMRNSPNSSEGAEARRLIESLTTPKRAEAESIPAGMVGVRNIRHWSDSKRQYTRVVIDLDKDVKFEQGKLENPDRIYFDLEGTKVTRALASRPFPVDGDFLQQIRVGQNKPDVVRVVLDFKSVSDYNVFWLPDPYRLVVDISGQVPSAPRIPEAVVAEGKPTPPASTSPSTAPAPAPPKSTEPPAAEPSATATADLKVAPEPRDEGYTIYQQLGLEPRRILIDAGHGGHDPGTMGKGGLREKDLVLDISNRVAKLLREDSFEVLMTRSTDVFIPLEERTAIANSKGVDLFVSIHVNAARSRRARGTETYFLNLATTPDAAEVAARENASTTRRVSELNDLLQKVMNNSKIAESRALATFLQDSMAESLFTSKKDKRNRGVKKAPFYVLLGAQMPAALVEVAYLSNSSDAKLLADTSYRQKVAASIATGIRRYHDTMAKTTKVTVPAGAVAQN